jgi:uncharacterized membrane protein YcjF (UPF0283 family)
MHADNAPSANKELRQKHRRQYSRNETSKERSYRKQRDRWELRRSIFEDMLVPFAAILGLSIIAGVAMHVINEWQCDACVYIAAGLSLITASIWFAMYALEFTLNRLYQKLRLTRKLRENGNNH